MSKKLKIYLGFIYLISCSFLLILASQYSSDFNLADIIFLLAVIILVNNFSMFFNSMTEIITSMNLPVLIPALVILNPFWVGIIAAIGTIEYNTKKIGFVWYKFLFNRAAIFLAAANAALIFKLSRPIFDGNSFPILSILSAVLVYFFINNLLVYIVINISKNDVNNFSLLNYFRELSKNLITSYFIGLILLFSYINFGKVFFLLIIVLLFIVKDFFYSRLQQMNSYTQIIESFLKVIDSKDQYTEDHCKRVADYTYHLCNEIDLSRARAERIINVAKIHDIGKIYVDDDILTTSDKLTEREYKEIQQHTVYGYQLLKDIDILKDDLDIMLHHHERWDGTGYPDGLKGEEIPMGARILAVCDSLDVMITGRSYKPPMTKEEIILEFKVCSGGQFDPEIAEAMIKLIKDGYFDNKFKSKKEIRQLDFSLEYQ